MLFRSALSVCCIFSRPSCQWTISVKACQSGFFGCLYECVKCVLSVCLCVYACSFVCVFMFVCVCFCLCVCVSWHEPLFEAKGSVMYERGCGLNVKHNLRIVHFQLSFSPPPSRRVQRRRSVSELDRGGREAQEGLFICLYTVLEL